jgi:hypothetical protein
MKRLLLAALILAAFASCEKDKETVKILFYTNAQLVTNCGSFNVNVYVDDKLVGTLQTAYSAKSTSISCDTKDEDGGILAVEVEKGKEHTYIAIGDCKTNMIRTGAFCLSDFDCMSIFIDYSDYIDFPKFPDEP